MREIDESLADLAISLGRADGAPTLQASDEFIALKKHLEESVSQWEAMKQKDLNAFNQRLQKSGIEPLGIGVPASH